MIRVVLVMALLGLSACADREQVAQAKRGYQGKPDTAAWGSGDRASWEAEIDRRTLAQDEYKRIND